jgi:hypothetical protein
MESRHVGGAETDVSPALMAAAPTVMFNIKIFLK